MTKTSRKTATTVASATNFTQQDIKEARKALFRSLEESALEKKNGNGDNDSSRNDENDDDSATTNDDNLLLRNLVTLFTMTRCSSANNNADQKNLLCQVMRDFSAADMRRFCNALEPTVQDLVTRQAFLASDNHEGGPSDSARGGNNEEEDYDSVASVTDVEASQALQFLRLVTILLQAYWEGRQPQGNKSVTVVPEFWNLLVPLHNTLTDLLLCGPLGRTLQSLLLSLCESIWHSGLPDRSEIISKTFTVLLEQALEQGATARRWNRLYDLRDALTLFDWENASSRWMRDRIVGLAVNPYSLQHGKRFLSFILQLEPDDVIPRQEFKNHNDSDEEEEEDDDPTTTTLNVLAADLHQAIKVQVPTAKTSMLKAYGEIYWKAWKDTDSEAVHSRLEATVWQDYVYAVIHAQNAATYKAVRTVLTPLHQHAKVNDTELLHRLYGPVLWRSLRATNPVVRLHATHVLAAVFPLTTPTRIEPAITQACDALNALLQADDDRVRAAGVQAAGQVLGDYWGAVPTAALHSILNIMVTQLASDAPNANVRASVLQAVAKLLKFPVTHAVLRPLLPALANLFHDRVEVVRKEAVGLLLTIKKTPGFKYYHVVPHHHLLARLATEAKPTGFVAQALTALMINSYVPADKEQAVRRAVRFVSERPDAAHVFYANVAAHLDVVQVVKLTLVFWKTLVAAILNNNDEPAEASVDGPSKGKRRRTKKRNETSRSPIGGDFSQHAGLLSSTDVTLWSRVAGIVSTLWESIEDQLDQSDYNECSHDLLKGFAGQTLIAVLQRLEQGDLDTQDDRYRTTASILQCAGRLPTEAVDDLVKYIAKALENPTTNSSAHFALLCLWDQTEKVTPTLASSLALPTRGLFKSSSPEGAPGVIPSLPPAVALDIVADLLRGSDPSSVAARESILQSPSARSTVASALEQGLHRAQVLLKDGNVLADVPSSEMDHTLNLCELFGRFCLHMQGDPNETDLNEYAQTLLHWTTEHLLPVLTKDKQAIFEDVDLSRISIDQSFRAPLSPLLASPAPRRSNRNNTPVRLDCGLDATKPAPAANPVAANRIQQDLAIALFQSVCLLLCEWLAVGRPGAFVIAEAAQEWSAVLVKHQDKLLTPMVRLAVHLIKASHDAGLLSKIIVHCREDQDCIVLEKGLVALLATRGITAQEVRKVTYQSISDALGSLTEAPNFDLIHEFPATMKEAWPYPSGAMGTALAVTLGNPQAIVEMTTLLVNGIADRSEKYRLAVFHFLFVVLSEEVPAEMNQLVQSVSSDPAAAPLIQQLGEIAAE